MLLLIGSEMSSAGSMQAETSLLIEGWRGINHSYCLLSQRQILELLKIEGKRNFHHDLPVFQQEMELDGQRDRISRPSSSGYLTLFLRRRVLLSIAFIEFLRLLLRDPRMTAAER